MKRLLLFLGLALYAVPAAASTIAITEFLDDANGSDADLEWIELFNYGPAAVDLGGYRISENTGTYILPTYLMAPGEYVILAINPTAFAANWPSVTATVLGPWAPMGNLNNTDDEIKLADPAAVDVWTLGYTDDATFARATFLVDSSWAFTAYGDIVSPGIVRNGNDVTGTLGYEGNDHTPDPDAFTGLNGDVGSPGSGQYTQIPEPALWALLGAGFLALASRRR